MSLGGGGPQTVSTNGYRYPKWAEPAIMQYFVDAMAMSYQAFSDYQSAYGIVSSTVAPAPGSLWTYDGVTHNYISSESSETTALTTIISRAINGSLPVQSAASLISANLAGTNLTAKYGRKGDEYKARVDALKQEFNEVTIPVLAERFESLGAFGGSAHGRAQYQAAEELSKNILQIGKEIFYGDFVAARADMNTSISSALTIANQSFDDFYKMRQAGLMQRENATIAYDEDYAAYRSNMELPIQRFGLMGNAIKMLSGTSSAEIRPYYKPSAFAEIAGLGLAGLGAYAAIKRGEVQ